jgi:hypothetical protein
LPRPALFKEFWGKKPLPADFLAASCSDFHTLLVLFFARGSKRFFLEGNLNGCFFAVSSLFVLNKQLARPYGAVW